MRQECLLFLKDVPAAPTQHLVCSYIAHQKEGKEKPPKVFSWLNGEKMNPFWLWWNQMQPTHSMGDFSAFLEILTWDWEKTNQKPTPKKATTTKATKANDTKKKAKKLSFGDVHWNLHTPTGKTVLSSSFLNPSSRLTGTHPFLMPVGIQLFSSCRSLPSLAGSETLSARPDKLWRSSSLFVGF